MTQFTDLFAQQADEVCKAKGAVVRRYPGHGFGKGMVMPDGSVVTWATNQFPDGSPSHSDVQAALSVPHTRATFRIADDGTFRMHDGVRKHKKVAKGIKQATGLKPRKKSIEAVAKSVNYRHSIYSGGKPQWPGLRDQDVGAPLSPYNDDILTPAEQAERDMTDQAVGIGDYRSAQNLPAQSPHVLEARDVSNRPISGGGNAGLQGAYPGPGRSYTRPTVPANPSDMQEGIDLTTPNASARLQQRYGGPLLPRLHPSDAARLAVHPGLSPAARRLAARRARNGKR